VSASSRAAPGSITYASARVRARMSTQFIDSCARWVRR
jgi:hypothetical protein